METDCGFLSRAELRHFTSSVLHQVEGEGDLLDGSPGKSLTSRYCLKLIGLISTAIKKLERLRQALQEYECDRWQNISAKVGNGFSAAACEDKAAEMNVWLVE